MAANREPGNFPTLLLTPVLSQRAGVPGDIVSIRVEGTDAASLVRGKVLSFEREHEGQWQPVGALIATASADGQSHWLEPGSGPLGSTTEGHRGTAPLYFNVPPLPPGDYRIRLDLIHPNDNFGDVQARIATLYAALRVLPAQTGSTSA